MNIERWHKLMLNLSLPPSDDSFHALFVAYSSKTRHYHSTVHIDAMLKHFDQTCELAKYPAELELAIWFHDAIYKPFSKTNEHDSAEWAKNFLMSKDYTEIGIERVYQLIMATQHDEKVTNNDEQLLVDIDLTILGAPEHVYDQFESNVRKEYKLVPGFIYRKKRKQLLQSFLDSEHIFNLPYFRSNFENTARDNISRAIKQI